MTSDAPFILRRPLPADAAEIAAVHTRSWRETYTGLVPERFFDDAALRGRQKLWAQLLADPEGRDRIQVAEVAGAIVGFAEEGHPVEPDPARERELRVLYLLREYHGTGAGQAVLDAALPPGPAQVWVAEANPRAICFYERNGFRADGTVFVDPDVGDLRSIRMVR